MKNLKIFTTLIITIFVTSISIGQDVDRSEHVKERMKAQRTAFITQKLELTEVEAQKFWPIYNEYTAEKRALKSEKNQEVSLQTSDKDAEMAINNYFDAKSKELEMQKKYVARFKTVLPTNKVAMLLNIQKDFSKEVMQNMRERRSGPDKGSRDGRPTRRGQ